MKKIKILTPIVTAAALSGTAMTIVSCGQTQNEKTIPNGLLYMEETTLRGLKDGADISQYNTLSIPSNTRVVDIDAFNDNSVNYTNIKTLKLNKGLRQIRKNAFAGLKNLDLIDCSDFDIDTIVGLTIEQDAFGEKLPSYCFVKLPKGTTSKAEKDLKDKLIACGIPESWFVEKTEGNVTITDEKKNAKYDGIDPTTISATLAKPVKTTDKIEITISKTAGTDKVGIKLIDQPEYIDHNLSYKVELAPDEGKTLVEGDYVEYKLTVVNKTISSTENDETTTWVQVIENCKVSYKTPELYVTSIEAQVKDTSKVFHQGDKITKDDVIVEAINNDRSRFILEYSQDGSTGYTVDDVPDFSVGYTLTEADINAGAKTLKARYNKKGVGEFENTVTFTNFSLKVETIIINGGTQVYRGATASFSVGFLPAGSATNVVWSISPKISGVTITPISSTVANLSVADDVDPQTITITATDETDPQTSGSKTNYKIEIPPADEVVWTKTYDTCLRGSKQQEYKFQAKVNNPASLQGITYSIKETQPASTDDKVSINANTGVVTIGKNVAYGTKVTVVATATDGSEKQKEHQFTVDIPAPTSIKVSGNSILKRAGTSNTYTTAIEPDGAEQTVTWQVKKPDGTAASNVSINASGVLSATAESYIGDVVVTATTNPQSKKSVAKISDSATVNVRYADLTAVTIKNKDTLKSVTRGSEQKYWTTFEATVNSGAYSTVVWSLDGEHDKDTTIDATTGVLKVAPQTADKQLTVKATVTYTDPDGVVTTKSDTHTVTVLTPAIEDVTVKATFSELVQGSEIKYEVNTITPSGADKNIAWKLTTDSATSKIKIAEQTSTYCIVSAEEYAEKIGGHVTIVDKLTSPTFTKDISSFTVVAPTFAQATWTRILSAIETYENSSRTDADKKALCDTFKDTKIEDGETITLSKFVGKTNSIKINDQSHGVRIIGIEHDTISSGTYANQKAAFTFEFTNVICGTNGISIACQRDSIGTTDKTAKDYAGSNLHFALNNEDSSKTVEWWEKSASETSKTYTKSVYQMLPSYIQTKLKEVNKTVLEVNTREQSQEKEKTNWTLASFTAKLFPLSWPEMTKTGSTPYMYKVEECLLLNDETRKEGTSYDYYNVSSRPSYKKKQVVMTGSHFSGQWANQAGAWNGGSDNGSSMYWLRSPAMSTSNVPCQSWWKTFTSVIYPGFNVSYVGSFVDVIYAWILGIDGGRNADIPKVNVAPAFCI